MFHNWRHGTFIFRQHTWIMNRKSTWRYLNWSAAGESPIISDASLSALDAFCSPSDAMILALASLDASAWMWWMAIDVKYAVVVVVYIFFRDNHHYIPTECGWNSFKVKSYLSSHSTLQLYRQTNILPAVSNEWKYDFSAFLQPFNRQPTCNIIISKDIFTHKKFIISTLHCKV